MEVMLYRIDGRLIHGQVIVSFTKTFHPNQIVVTDDNVAKDEFQKTLLEFAKPQDIDLLILSIKDTAEAIINEKLSERAIIVLKTVDDALGLIENGVYIKEINVGGMYHEPGKKQYAKALFADEHDINLIKKLKEKGVSLYYQMAAQDVKEDVYHLLKI